MADNPNGNSNVIRFSELTPEHHVYVDDGDGGTAKQYQFAHPDDFGTHASARFNNAFRRYHEAREKLRADNGDTNAGADCETAARDIVAVIIPDLPEERRRLLTFVQCVKLADWWQKQYVEWFAVHSKNGGEAISGGKK